MGQENRLRVACGTPFELQAKSSQKQAALSSRDCLGKGKTLWHPLVAARKNHIATHAPAAVSLQRSRNPVRSNGAKRC